MPKHIAIIMDGNGRWAESRGLNRTKGHEAGAKSVRSITEFCAKNEIKYLTLYAFSTENWKRPKFEVEALMKLLAKYLKKEIPTYKERGIRFNTIGDISKFSTSLQNAISNAKDVTSSGNHLVQTLALNYGGQDEIVRTAKKLCENNIEFTKENFKYNLDTKDLPPVDLLIRTGGDRRVSNFLLWQAAYAELFFNDSLWPDFSISEFENILKEFSLRERRFGGI
jgi:undecaprenyl diphosphate synthase